MSDHRPTETPARPSIEPSIEPSIAPWRISHHELVLSPAMHRAPAWRVGAIMAIGVLILAMLASEPLAGWANRLPAHPIAEAIVAACQSWHRAMQAIGLTEVFTALKDLFAAMRGL